MLGSLGYIRGRAPLLLKIKHFSVKKTQSKPLPYSTVLPYLLRFPGLTLQQCLQCSLEKTLEWAGKKRQPQKTQPPAWVALSLHPHLWVREDKTAMRGVPSILLRRLQGFPRLGRTAKRTKIHQQPKRARTLRDP